jgi:hypothetical protein
MSNNVKTIMGIAAASVKTVSGIAAASVKTVMNEALVLIKDIATITSYAAVEASGSAITDAQYGVNMSYDEDNNFVYVQYALESGGGGAVVGEFNSSNNDVDFGAEQTIESSNAFSGNSCDYDKYNNRIWSAWIGGGDNTIYARCGTIASNKTISWGTTLTIQGGNNSVSNYNQGLIQQGLAVDQSTGKCLVVWNNAADSFGGASSHHPNGVILTVDTSDNSITKSNAVRMATGGSGESYPIMLCHYDPDNTEWVAVTDANGSSTSGINALRITNSSGNPAAANFTSLGSNSGHTLQGSQSVNGGRYGGLTFIYDESSDYFMVGSSTSSATPKIFAFENTGSAINFDTTGIAVSHGTASSQSGRGGTMAYSHARGRFMSHGNTGSAENLEIFSYDGSSFTSHNDSSLIAIVSDDDGFYRGGASMQDMSAFADGAVMIVGTDYDSRDPYYIIIEAGG